jgi:tetratricopeptide (TPR) repeat protein
MRFSFQLSRKWRERLRRWGRTTLSWVTYPYFIIVGVVNWFIALIVSAWHTRHFRYLLQGFPALFAAAGVAVAGVFVANSIAQEQRANLAKDYLMQAGDAWRKAASFTDADDKDKSKRREQLGMARTYMEKAISLEGGERDDLKYFLALVLEQSALLGYPEDYEHCRAIMYKLAPESSNGYQMAHLWRAIHLASNFAMEPVVVAAMENHLTRAYEIGKSDPDSLLAQESAYHLSNLLVGQQRYAEAIPLLEKTEGKIPRQRLILGSVYEAVGRHDDAMKMFQSAEKYFQYEADKKVDNKEARLYWGRALMAQQKYEQALEAYQKGVVVNKDPRFLLDASEAYRFWELKLAADPKSKLSDRLSLVQKGLQALPSNFQLLARLYAFSTMKGPEAEEAQKQIREMLANGIQEPILYFIMGSHAYTEGRTDEAKNYWQMSYAKDPTFSTVANNLAWFLAHDQKNPEPEKALKMIEQVIAQRPDIPNYYGTRGQILVKLKKHAEAMPDLLKGLKAQPEDLGLNEAIAEAYEVTGDRTMAEVHRKKIVILKEKAAKEKLDAPKLPTLPKELEKPKPEDPKPELPKTKIGEIPPTN